MFKSIHSTFDRKMWICHVSIFMIWYIEPVIKFKFKNNLQQRKVQADYNNHGIKFKINFYRIFFLKNVKVDYACVNTNNTGGKL